MAETLQSLAAGFSRSGRGVAVNAAAKWQKTAIPISARA
jgi:hypothetical protein